MGRQRIHLGSVLEFSVAFSSNNPHDRLLNFRVACSTTYQRGKNKGLGVKGVGELGGSGAGVDSGR